MNRDEKTRILSFIEALSENKKPPELNLSGEDKDLEKSLNLLAERVSGVVSLTDCIAGGCYPCEVPESSKLTESAIRLHASVRHIIWKLKCIEDGDYSQKFHGSDELSVSLNALISRLEKRENNVLIQRDILMTVFDNIEPIIILNETTKSALYVNTLASKLFGLNKGFNNVLKNKIFKHILELPHNSVGNQIFDEDLNRWYNVTCATMPWGEEVALLFHCVDITAHKHRENYLEHAANTDKLTGLYNRRAFETVFKQYWDLCKNQNKPLSALIFDIDFFKAINDKYGHLQGDKCLVAFADILRGCFTRSSDIISRFGGEEFLVLLPFTSKKDAMRIAENVRAVTELRTVALECHSGIPADVNFTISGGVASLTPYDTFIPNQLINAADAALYQAKQSGRNNIVYKDV